MNDNRIDQVIPFDYLINSGSLSAGANGTANITIENNAFFELHEIHASSSLDADTDLMPNNFSVRLEDQSTGRLLANARIPQRCFTSPACRKYRLARPTIFAPNANIVGDFLNLSAGSANTIKLVLRGFKLKTQSVPLENQTQSVIPFDYLVSSGALAASSAGVTTVTLQQDSWFELHEVFASSSLDAVGDWMPNNFELQIARNAPNDFLSNARIPQRALTTPADNGYHFARPILIPPGEIFLLDFLNLIADTNTITVVFRGFKLFNLV